MVLSKEEFLLILKKFSNKVTDYEICKKKETKGARPPISLDDDFDISDSNKFTTTLRCNIKNEHNESTIGYVVAAKEWIKKFSEVTSTCWIVDSNSAHTERKKTATRKTWTMKFACQLSAVNKKSPTKRKIDSRTGCTRGGLRNMKCGAFITFRVLKKFSTDVANNKRRQDAFYLVRDKPLLSEIEINFDHSHDIGSQAALSLNRVTSPQKQLLDELFKNSHTPAQALKASRDLAMEDGAGQLELVSANKVAPINAVKNLYSKFTKENWGDKTGPGRMKAIKSRMEELKNNGCLVAVNEDPFSAVMITALMQRGHKYNKSGDIVYVDSTGQLERGGTTCTLFATHTPCGVMPLACAFHDGQTEEVFKLVLKMCEQLLGNKGFYGSQRGPKNFMTDKCFALKNALKFVWPHSRQHLCSFHVVQAIRDWLQNKTQEELNFDARQLCANSFYRVLYSPFTEIEWNEEELLQNCPVIFCDYYKKCWSHSKKEWIRSWRPVTLHGSHTNNYIERLNRIIKETVLHRYREFNVVSLMTRIDKDLTQFFEYKLSNPIQSWTLQRIRGKFAKDTQYLTENNGAMIKRLGTSDSYSVPSSSRGIPYLVHGNTGFCACSSSVGGKFCKHLASLIILGLAKPPNAPLLDSCARKDMAFLAFGDAAIQDDGFYADLTPKQANTVPEVMQNSVPMLRDIEIDTCLESNTQDTNSLFTPEESAFNEQTIHEMGEEIKNMWRKFYNCKDEAQSKVMQVFRKRVADVKSSGVMCERFAQLRHDKRLAHQTNKPETEIRSSANQTQT